MPESDQIATRILSIPRSQRLFFKLRLNLRIPRDSPSDVAADAMPSLKVRGRVGLSHGDARDMVTNPGLNRGDVLFVNVGRLRDEIEQSHQLESVPQRHR